MIYIGEAHKLGTGLPVNLDEAERWFVRAEQAGSPRASYLLGRLYLKQLRYDAARDAFERGADKGFVPALHFLGRMYFAGMGVEKDAKMGEQLFRRAAEAGSVFAKAGLAQYLMRNHSDIGMKLRGFFLLLGARFDLLKVLLTEGATSDRLR
jgi:TPR repeat protein